MKHTLNISICTKHNSIFIMFLFENEKKSYLKLK